MEINLRKANAIQAEIRKAITAVKAENTVNVTEFTQDVAGTISKAAADYKAAVDRTIQLTTALYNIRNSVAEANANAGVNTILGQVEAVDKLMGIHSIVAGVQVAKTLDEINARLEKLKNQTGDSASRIYGDRYNTVETTVVDQETVNAAKAKVKELKRQRQNLQDKLLSLNVNQQITITAADEAALKEEGIL